MSEFLCPSLWLLALMQMSRNMLPDQPGAPASALPDPQGRRMKDML